MGTSQVVGLRPDFVFAVGTVLQELPVEYRRSFMDAALRFFDTDGSTASVSKVLRRKDSPFVRAALYTLAGHLKVK